MTVPKFKIGDRVRRDSVECVVVGIGPRGIRETDEEPKYSLRRGPETTSMGLRPYWDADEGELERVK